MQKVSKSSQNITLYILTEVVSKFVHPGYSKNQTNNHRLKINNLLRLSQSITSKSLFLFVWIGHFTGSETKEIKYQILWKIMWIVYRLFIIFLICLIWMHYQKSQKLGSAYFDLEKFRFSVRGILLGELSQASTQFAKINLVL